METIDPTTGRKIRFFNEHSFSDAESIVNQAERSFQSWRKFSFKERAQNMDKAVGLLMKNKKSYARLMAEEMGKPFMQGIAEVEKCAWVCNFYAQEAKYYLSAQPIGADTAKSYIRYEPLGVVLAIMPWNFPFW